jgi:hypothetical protein
MAAAISGSNDSRTDMNGSFSYCKNENGTH